MKWLLVLLVACADHPGTYLEVHGGDLAFDHVEFYFGKSLGSSFGTPSAKDVEGPAYERQLADSDLSVAAKAGVTTDLTYYLPYSDGNARLGDYALAIASKGGQPVGIGGVADFPVPATGYTIVDVALEPYNRSAIETWQADCLAWKRSHGEQPIGFVHADDRDCDGEVASRDCDDTAFCLPGDPGCQPVRELCDEGGCAYGCQIDGDCAPRLCMPIFVCNPQLCASASTLPEKFACLALTAGADHPDYYLPASAGQPCGDPLVIDLPNGATCTNPTVEFTEMIDNWTVTVAADATDKACVLSFANANTNAFWNGDHHVVISFDGATPDGPRSTIFLGIKADNMGCAHSMAPTGPLAINACQ
ncbi:MAG: hypothetical protein ABI678_13355 [Kofleriaceae bacterium]